jgi:predicted dinucleotide-binding enzyme
MNDKKLKSDPSPKVYQVLEGEKVVEAFDNKPMAELTAATLNKLKLTDKFKVRVLKMTLNIK